jgi:hypothetical protein
MILSVNRDISLNSVNKLIFVMVKSCVFFAVRTECLNVIQMRFGFKALKQFFIVQCAWILMTAFSTWLLKLFVCKISVVLCQFSLFYDSDVSELSFLLPFV